MGLRSSHVQSMLASFKFRKWLQRSHPMAQAATEQLIRCPDGTCLQAWVSAQSQQARGWLVMIHGWEGCHDSIYLHDMACALFDAGYDIVRLNLRDHGGTHALNHGMFHSALIEETISAIQQLEAERGTPPTAVIGFSLGGNFSLRVGLLGPDMGLQPGLTVGICPAINPAATTRCLDTGAALYRRYFLKKWRRTLLAKAQAWPGEYDFSELLQLDNFQQITRLFAERHTPFGALDKYFAAYTIDPEAIIEAPGRFAVLTAQDDPVVPYADFSVLNRQRNVPFLAPRHGGHCGFVENWTLRSWANRQVEQLIRAVG